MQGGVYVPQQITPLRVPPWMLPDFIYILKSKRGPWGVDSGVIIEPMACYESEDRSEHCFLEPDELSIKGGYLYVTDSDEPFSGLIHSCSGTEEYDEGSFKDDWVILCGDQCWADVPPKGAYVR